MFYPASSIQRRTGTPLSSRGFLPTVAAAVAIGLTLAANNAAADTISYALTNSNRAALAGPFAQLTVDLTSPTTAIVTVDALDHGSLKFLMSGAGTVGVNVNGAFSVDDLNASNAATGMNSAPMSDERERHSRRFGSFNAWLSSPAHSSTEMSFGLTAVGGNSWNSAPQVLMPNGKGQVAAIHLLACPTGDSTCVGQHRGQGIAAFAGSADPDATPIVSTPIPAAAWLFGSGLLGFIAIARRRVKTSDSPPLTAGDSAAA